jgi:hypothetical protein
MSERRTDGSNQQNVVSGGVWVCLPGVMTGWVVVPKQSPLLTYGGKKHLVIQGWNSCGTRRHFWLLRLYTSRLFGLNCG